MMYDRIDYCLLIDSYKRGFTPIFNTNNELIGWYKKIDTDLYIVPYQLYYSEHGYGSLEEFEGITKLNIESVFECGFHITKNKVGSYVLTYYLEDIIEIQAPNMWGLDELLTMYINQYYHDFEDILYIAELIGTTKDLAKTIKPA